MRPNNSFKPNLLRYTNNVAGKACHVVGFATQVGLTQALGRSGEFAVYCAMFIWEPGTYDAEFHRLNALIDELARSLPGFLGVDSWQSQDGSRKCAHYYWSDLDTLKMFSTHPTHQEAKRQYARWYKGYHIVVSEVIRSYGDGNFPHITPNGRKRSAA